MRNPEVTVLLPVFNSESTLKETLDSLWNQTFSDFEVLVVDDGSTDRTAELLEEESDPRLRILRNPERLKLSGALNRGLEEARGTLIARMDADDLALPQRLEIQKTYLEDHPGISLCGTATRHFGAQVDKVESYPESPDAIRAFSLFNCPFAHPTVMFRASDFREHGFRYDGSFYPTEDFELWARVVHVLECANLPEVCLDYRVHEKSMTGADWSNMDLQAQRLLREQFERLGVTMSGTSARLHREIGMARVAGEDLEQAREHLAQLLDQNEANEFCPVRAFANEVRERWFHVCMNCEGRDRVRWYRDAGIWRGGSAPLSRQALLLASTWRRG